MSDIKEISGIGLVLSAKLNLLGIKTIEDFVDYKTKKLIEVPGLGEALVSRLKASASVMVAEELVHKKTKKETHRANGKNLTKKNIKKSSEKNKDNSKQKGEKKESKTKLRKEATNSKKTKKSRKKKSKK